MSILSRIFDFADVRQRRQAKPDELRWEDASTLFTLAAAFAIATLAILTLIGCGRRGPELRCFGVAQSAAVQRLQ